ncbi:MAG: FhaA domain-containing protein [Candidatus Geothermincolia bacterium]
MGILADFERRLERLFEGMFSKGFRSGVHPLEIGRRLLREVDEGRVITPSETLAPNSFRVEVSAEDYDRLSGFGGTVLSEMGALVIEHASRRGYTLLTAPRIELVRREGLREGDFLVTAEVAGEEPVEATVAARAPASEGAVAVLRQLNAAEPQFWRVQNSEATIGRGAGNDIVIADPRVSRSHAVIAVRPEGLVLRDLHSTNGTTINGHRVEEGLLDDGDVIGFGDTSFQVEFERA